jgi:multidrug efflux pump subunit AcrA (membrane-fusion protein)
VNRVGTEAGDEAPVVGTAVTAAALAAGRVTAGGAVPAQSAASAAGVQKTMWPTKGKVAAAVLLAAGMTGVAAGGAADRTPVAGQANPDPRGAAAPYRPARSDRVDVPSQRDGILLVIGTDLKPGEKVPPDQVVVVKAGDEETKYRRLREGDTVEEGQLLARVDDTLARDEVAGRRAAVDAARADWQASVKTRDEAEERYTTISRRYHGGPGSVSLEDYRGAKLTYDRYVFEEVARKAAVAKAEAELRQAQTALRMHEIRSPVRGCVRDIYKNRGEAVRALEPVVQVRVAE